MLKKHLAALIHPNQFGVVAFTWFHPVSGSEVSNLGNILKEICAFPYKTYERPKRLNQVEFLNACSIVSQVGPQNVQIASQMFCTFQ